MTSQITQEQRRAIITKMVYAVLHDQYPQLSGFVYTDECTLEDLGFDSLDSVEAIMALEDVGCDGGGNEGFNITDEDAETFKTVGDVINYFDKYYDGSLDYFASFKNPNDRPVEKPQVTPPKCDYPKWIYAFVDELLSLFENGKDTRYVMSAHMFTVLARQHCDANKTQLANCKGTAFNRSIRELMTTRGYNITIGANAVITKLKVVSVDREQWPQLVQNICERIIECMGVATDVSMTPAQFRNIATVWPDQEPAFNNACVVEMRNKGFDMKFTKKRIYVKLLDTEATDEKPTIFVLTASQLLDYVTGVLPHLPVLTHSVVLQGGVSAVCVLPEYASVNSDYGMIDTCNVYLGDNVALTNEAGAALLQKAKVLTHSRNCLMTNPKFTVRKWVKS